MYMGHAHSITFYFDDSDDETARALMAMAEFLQDKNDLSASAVEMLGYIADNLADWASLIRDEIIAYDAVDKGGSEKAHRLAEKFREVANRLDGLPI
jgi:hypothetical protein